MKWEMQSVKYHIDITNMSSHTRIPQWSAVISQEQYDIIDMFANKSKDENFNDIFVINDLKFRIVPYVGTVD